MISSMEKMKMARDKKQTKKFVISVEGDNSEKLYFQHLQKLINNYDHKIFNVNFTIKKMQSQFNGKKNRIQRLR